MAESAFQTQYQQQMIAGYEQRQSILRSSVSTTIVTKGNQATFLIVDSGGATAVTRGLNGLIPARPDNLTQPVVTLTEWHDLVEKTGFNIFASQGDQIRAMQMTTMTVMNTKVDEIIFDQLDTATNEANSTAEPMSLDLATKAVGILGSNKVMFDGNIMGVLSPAALAYLLRTPEFTSKDYVSRQPLESGGPQWTDQQGWYNWMGIKWMVSTQVPGIGTADEHLFIWHRSAIGHAADTANLRTFLGYNEEQDYSYVRTTQFMGAKLLQNNGVVMIHHDASAMVAV